MTSQKFISRNRAPRVQIEYDVEVYGAEKRIQLPFVMGVLADLRGNAGAPQPSPSERKFLEISVENLDERMAGMRPGVSLRVPNTLTEDGQLQVDISFESMDDFSPAAIARKVPALARLLEARTRLSNLITYMDGKSGAEDLIAGLIHDPEALASLASQPEMAGTDAAPSPTSEQ